MNHRFKELAEQAKEHADTYDDLGTPVWFQFYNEKLAQLIYSDIITVVAAQALLGESALDVFKNLKNIYEGN